MYYTFKLKNSNIPFQNKVQFNFFDGDVLTEVARKIFNFECEDEGFRPEIQNQVELLIYAKLSDEKPVLILSGE